MKKILLILILISSVFVAKAGKVYPFPATITQSDGTQLTVIGHGDEHQHWFTTTDGVLLCRVGTDFFIASTVGNDLVATNQLAHEAKQRSSAEIALVKKQDKDLFYKKAAEAQKARAMKREPVEVDNTFLPHTGSQKVPVILVDFQDKNFSLTDPKKSFDQYLNGEGHPEDYGNYEHRNYGSVSQYFKDMSFGKFSPRFDIYGPFRLDNNLVYYGEGRNDRMDRFLPEVVEKVKNSIDFSQYDNNNDGIVDLVYIVYAGYAASVTQNSEDCIWPKVSTREIQIDDNLKLFRFGVSNELIAYPGAFSEEPINRINGVGLFCHEFSHALGLPDFYPTLSTSVADNQSMEFWSLMDGGEYVDNGWCPAAYTAWEREAMGWVDIEDLTEDTNNLQIKPIDNDGGKAYRIRNDNDNTGNEYFIIENIQNQKWNTKQKGHGLLMYHVNYISERFKLTGNDKNSVNNTLGQPCMAVVPADGLLASSSNRGEVRPWGTGENGIVTSKDYYTQLSGDPFPGSSATTEVNETMSLPNFQVYNGTSLNKALTDISENDGIITLTFINDFSKYTTGISDGIGTENTNNCNAIYTLDGRYVGASPTGLNKGIYIIGNRKVVIK